jgi:tetratricopeptide (TPR) repeat protein
MDDMPKSRYGRFDQPLPLPQAVLDNAADAGTLLFAAEYAYDDCDQNQAAALFERLAEETGKEVFLEMAASALYLSGNTDGAVFLWKLLAGGGSAAGIGARGTSDNAGTGTVVAVAGAGAGSDANGVGTDVVNPTPGSTATGAAGSTATGAAGGAAGAGYNLAAIEKNTSLRENYLRLFFLAKPAGKNDIRMDKLITYALLLLSRSRQGEAALATLEASALAGKDPLIDLEMLRRFVLPGLPPERRTGEIWRLIERYPESAEVSAWAAWYFAFQRQGNDLRYLLAANALEGAARDYYNGITLMTAGDWSNAERSLTQVAEGRYARAAAANIGLLHQARRSFTRALQFYAAAGASQASNAGASFTVQDDAVGTDSGTASLTASLTPFELSRLALRTGLLLQSLGRNDEARPFLEQAKALNSEDVRVWRALAH